MAYTTLTAARQLLSDMVGDLHTGTTTSQGGAAGATLIDSELKGWSGNQDDYYNNQWVIITSGARLGDERRISDFTASSGTVTPYTAFGAQLAASVTYEIHKIWTPTQKRRALNWALRRAYPAIGRNIIDEQITTVASRWSYRLGDYGSGSTVSYAAGTLTDTGKAWITNQFAGYRVQSGGNTSSVTSNTETVLTLSANWSPSTPTAADAYTVIHPINDLYVVEYESNESTATYPYARIPYETYAHQGTVTLQFGPNYKPSDSRTLRLRGRGYLTDWTSTETSSTEVEEHEIHGILYLAAHWLFQRTPALSASQDRDFYDKESRRYLAMWEAYKSTLATKRFPVKLWGPGTLGRQVPLSMMALAALSDVDL